MLFPTFGILYFIDSEYWKGNSLPPLISCNIQCVYCCIWVQWNSRDQHVFFIRNKKLSDRMQYKLVIDWLVSCCSDSGGFSRSSSIQSETSIPAPPGPPVKLRELPHLRWVSWSLCPCGLKEEKKTCKLMLRYLGGTVLQSSLYTKYNHIQLHTNQARDKDTRCRWW